MLKIVVKKDLCCGAGLCMQMAPEVFHLDELGYNDSDGEIVAPAKAEAARTGAKSCPEWAIQLVNVEEGAK